MSDLRAGQGRIPAPRTHATPQTWRSWSGLAATTPRQALSPATADEVVDAVLAARAHGLRVKMVGSGHSFTDIALTDGLLLHPHRLSGITAVDRDAMTVTALAGTPLHELNLLLDGLGLALHNMGDIDAQTIAGATATGTHGTGGRTASLSSQLAAFELVTADGRLRQARPDGTPAEAELFAAGRVGLGALGVLTTLTFHVEPAFHLEAVEVPMTWDQVVSGYDELVGSHLHFEAYWFPHTDRMLTKANDRVDHEPHPLSRTRAFLEDELLENRVYGAATRLGAAIPAARRPINWISARALGPRTYSDAAHRVLTAERKVRFREMEYAVPREAGVAALTAARTLIERRGWRVGFPVEIRQAPADDSWLSMAHGRESVYLAFHVHVRTDHREYFAGVEQVMLDHGGRPHWGKLHTLDAASLRPAYPRFDDFVAVRDRLDPDRLFANAYLDRVLGA